MTAENTSVDIAIAGAGIAGLTTALSLARSGREIRLYENAAELSEVGAGIQLSPNASRVLVDLGLRPTIERTAVSPDTLTIRSGRNGKELASLAYGNAFEDRYGAPYWVIHRGDLQRTLLEEVDKFPNIHLHTGHAVTGAEDTGDGVSITIYAEEPNTVVRSNLLIGADGVWSTVRSKVMGQPPAIYTGRTAWRATVPASTLSAEHARGTGLWLGPKAHLVHYPISAGKSINIVAITEDQSQMQGWTRSGESADLLSHFKGWSDKALAVLDAPESWLKWSLFAGSGHIHWSKGRTVLIGDAAHPMLPFMAQGGAMAIEDAAVMSRYLLEPQTEVETALERFVMARRSRVGRIVKTARRNGQIYHLAGPIALARNIVMRLLGEGGLSARFDWVYRWHPDEPEP